MKDEVDLFVNLIELKTQWEEMKLDFKDQFEDVDEITFSFSEMDRIFKTFTPFMETFKKDIKTQRTLIEYGI